MHALKASLLAIAVLRVKALICTRGNVTDNILSSLDLRDDNRSSFAYKAINASVERLGVGQYAWRLGLKQIFS